MHNIDVSLKAIQTYDPKKNIYLKVVGEGSSQYLKAEKKNWFGRLLMLLGFTNASMKKVIQFVNVNLIALYQNASKNNQTGAIKKLQGHINKYHDNHSKKYKNCVERLKQIMAPAIQKNAAKPNAANSSGRKSLPRSNEDAAVISGRIPLHTETLKMIKTIKQAVVKRNTLTKAGKGATPPTQQPAAKVDAEEEATIAAFVHEYKNKRNDSEDVELLLKRLSNPSQSVSKKKPTKNLVKKGVHANGKVPPPPKEIDRFPIKADMNALIAILQMMTPPEVSKYAAASEDVFKLKEGTVFRPSLILTVVCATFTKQQMESLIGTISKLYDNEPSTLLDAYFKIITLSPNKKHVCEEIVKLPRFFDCMFSVPAKKWSSDWTYDEKKAYEAEIWAEARLAEHYFFYLLRNKNAPNRDEGMRESWGLSRESICKRGRKILSSDEQLELGIMLAKNFDHEEWEKEPIILELFKNSKQLEKLSNAANENNKKYLKELKPL